MTVKWNWLCALGFIFIIIMVTWPVDVDPYYNNEKHNEQTTAGQIRNKGRTRDKAISEHDLLKEATMLSSSNHHLLQSHHEESHTTVQDGTVGWSLYLMMSLKYWIEWSVYGLVALGGVVGSKVIPKMCNGVGRLDMVQKIIQKMHEAIDRLCVFAPSLSCFGKYLTNFSFSGDIQLTHQRIQEAEKETLALRSQREQWIVERKLLRKHHDVIIHEIRDLRGQLDKTLKELSHLQKTNNDLKEYNEQIVTKYTLSQQEFKTANDKLQEITQQLKTAERDNEMLKSQINMSSMEREDIEARLKNIERELWKVKMTHKKTLKPEDITKGLSLVSSESIIRMVNSRSEIARSTTEKKSELLRNETLSISSASSKEVLSGKPPGTPANKSSSSWSTCDIDFDGISPLAFSVPRSTQSAVSLLNRHFSSCSICAERHCIKEHDVCTDVRCLNSKERCRCGDVLHRMKKSNRLININTNFRHGVWIEPGNITRYIRGLASQCTKSADQEKDIEIEIYPSSESSTDSYMEQLDWLRHILESTHRRSIPVVTTGDRQSSHSSTSLLPDNARPVSTSPAFRKFLKTLENVKRNKTKHICFDPESKEPAAISYKTFAAPTNKGRIPGSKLKPQTRRTLAKKPRVR